MPIFIFSAIPANAVCIGGDGTDRTPKISDFCIRSSITNSRTQCNDMLGIHQAKYWRVPATGGSKAQTGKPAKLPAMLNVM